jgi:hypothetical protein
MKCRFKGQFRVRVRHPRPWSIPPRATKNLNSPLVGLFSFGLDPLVSDAPIKNCPLKGQINNASLCQSMSFKTIELIRFFK